ncbi:protein of unknown function [Magnetospirillum sp. XM-1]|nr:protein of unknown function [Magnetospirillum sp. XM-1]
MFSTIALQGIRLNHRIYTFVKAPLTHRRTKFPPGCELSMRPGPGLPSLMRPPGRKTAEGLSPHPPSPPLPSRMTG